MPGINEIKKLSLKERSMELLFAVLIFIFTVNYSAILLMPLLSLFILESMINDDYSGTVMLFLSISLASIFLGGSFFAKMCILYIPILLCANIGVRKRVRGDKLLILMTVVLNLSFMLYTIYLKKVMSYDILSEIYKGAYNAMDSAKKAILSKNPDGTDMFGIFNNSTLFYERVRSVLSTFVTAISFLESFVCLKLSGYIYRRRGLFSVSEPFIEALKLPRTVFYTVLLSTLFLNFTSTNLISAEFKRNVINLLNFILAVQGLSFAAFQFTIRFKSKVLRNVYIIFSFLFLELMIFVNIILGIIDGVTNIRGE